MTIARLLQYLEVIKRIKWFSYNTILCVVTIRTTTSQTHQTQ